MHLKRLLMASTLVLLLLSCAFAQETTAGIQGTVKDATGGVIPNASVEVKGPALIGVKKVETDAGGYYRFANLPPGTYTLTVSATGFRTAVQGDIPLEVGRLPNVNFTMEVGSVSESVAVSEQASLVDTSESRVQTTITQNVLDNVPTQTRSFQSVIQFAPGARNEPMQAGYQIDGASNSENAYLIEGQETASLQDGHSAANVPMDFIQEVQVKTSGFEAEYGGALGGVVNVIQKRGSNDWHGSAFTYYSGSGLDAAPNASIIRHPQIPANNGAPRLDQPQVSYQPKQDHYRTVTPGFTLGGPLAKDRLWMFVSTAPELNVLARTVNFASSTNAPGARDFHRNINTYYSLARLDYLATQKIRVYGAWSYAYQRGTGTSLPSADSINGIFNSSSTTNPDTWNGGIGYVAPNTIYNVGADITITPTVVATTRFGYFYQDYQDRGLPSGIRYIYRDTNYPYNTGNAPALAGTKALDGTVIPSQYVNSTGWSNIGANSATVFDKWQRYSLNQDLAWFKHMFGTHNFKFGYAMNHGTNNVFNGFNTADVYVAWNVPYGPQTTNGIARCQDIIKTNQSKYGALGGSADGSACQGLWGTVNLRELGTTGMVGGWNHALYVQDAWTIARRLTLNLGVRFDKESLPTYDQSSGFQGVSFDWTQKVAPRIGAAYDILGNGKLKVFGSFGYFYDIMKYNLSRGSFGGDYWHDCVYALDSPDIFSILPSRNAQGHYCPIGGGATPAVGSFPAMRFIENYDYREPANDPNQIGTLGPTGLVDPNLQPMKQKEIVVGGEWSITNSMAFETRYSRKRLLRTIEDAGTITQNGEVYYITNPGYGVNTVVPNCNGCPPNPPAFRNYDGVEFRLTKRFASNWTGSFSYTYSRLYGNYTGLTATDISDGGAGRNGANADRAFDEPFMSFDAHGNEIFGPLPTDRPHTFKAYGYYNLRWWKFNTMLGGYQQIYSGAPNSSYVSVWGAPVFVEGRGNVVDLTRDPATGNWVAGGVHASRTPMFTQTDFSVSQEFHVSKTNERMIAKVGADCFNCLNQKAPIYFDTNMIRTSGLNPAQCGSPGTNCTPTLADNAGFDYGTIMTKGFDYIGQANSQGRTLNSRYNQPYGWQSPRTMRLQLTFIF